MKADETIKDMAEHGVRFDLTPTTCWSGSTEQERMGKLHSFYCDYIQRIDQSVRERARSALNEDKSDPVVCKRCGSRHVQHVVWVKSNTNEVVQDFGEWKDNKDHSRSWCEECQSSVDLCDTSIAEPRHCEECGLRETCPYRKRSVVFIIRASGLISLTRDMLKGYLAKEGVWILSSDGDLLEVEFTDLGDPEINYGRISYLADQSTVGFEVVGPKKEEPDA